MANPFETNGMFSWFELMTDDVEGAKKFYGEVIGWQFETDSNNPDYTLIRVDEEEMPIAGIFNRKKAMVDNPNAIPPHWGSYVTVKDINTALRLAHNLPELQ